jgi:hypothetical protein
MGGGLPDLAAGVSTGVVSELVESMSIPVLRSGAKKFRVTISCCWEVAAAGSVAAFLLVSPVSWEFRRFRLRTSVKSSSCWRVFSVHFVAGAFR